MTEYIDKHSEQVVSRLDNLLASVDDVITDWEITRENYNLTDDLVAEGTKIIQEEKAKKNG